MLYERGSKGSDRGNDLCGDICFRRSWTFADEPEFETPPSERQMVPAVIPPILLLAVLQTFVKHLLFL